MKQKLEGVFSKSLKYRTDLWYIKLQVNQMAHTKSPADYLIISADNNFLVECKQVDLRKNPKKTYTFDRLTQEEDLLAFEKKFNNNRSYVLLLTLNKMLKNSDFYFIPIKYYINVKNRIGKKSMTSEDLLREFNQFRLNYIKDRLEVPIK
jgi:hypothetical protein